MQMVANIHMFLSHPLGLSPTTRNKNIFCKLTAVGPISPQLSLSPKAGNGKRVSGSPKVDPAGRSPIQRKTGKSTFGRNTFGRSTLGRRTNTNPEDSELAAVFKKLQESGGGPLSPQSNNSRVDLGTDTVVATIALPTGDLIDSDTEDDEFTTRNPTPDSAAVQQTDELIVFKGTASFARPGDYLDEEDLILNSEGTVALVGSQDATDDENGEMLIRLGPRTDLKDKDQQEDSGSTNEQELQLHQQVEQLLEQQKQMKAPEPTFYICGRQ